MNEVNLFKDLSDLHTRIRAFCSYCVQPGHAGMKLLQQADPSVEVTIAPTGEHLVAASGEIHLAVCIPSAVARSRVPDAVPLASP